MIDTVGLIPINNYIKNLDNRDFGRSMIIQYTKDIYNLDITQELIYFENNVVTLWNGDINLYIEFDTLNPPKEIDDNSREYFNKYGKARFQKFISNSEELSNEDKAIPLFSPKDIHHVFPLTYGGDSSLQNLVFVSRFTHDLLHMNPFENIKECCFQAYDYLCYLGSIVGFTYLSKKYDFSKYAENKKMLVQMYKGALEEEMDLFYQYLNKTYSRME